MEQNKKTSRKTYMDVVRILAICGVIYIHSGDMGYSLYASTDNTALRYIYYWFAVISEVSVPLFFMVSGALLLGKEESFENIVKKRCSRIIIVLLVASLCHYLYNGRHDNTYQITMTGYFKGLLNNGFTGSLWFLYAYLLYLLILPFLRMLVRQMKGKHFVYLFGLCILFKGVIQVMLQCYGLELEIDIYEAPFFDKIFIYPIMGYYIENVVGDNYNRIHYIWGNLLLLIATSNIVAYLSMRRNFTSANFTRYDKGLFNSMLTAVIAVSIYALIRHIVQEISISANVKKILKVLGTNTFGVYLLERFVRENILGIYFWTERYLTRIGAAFILTIATFLICEGITFLLKKIPIIRELI